LPIEERRSTLIGGVGARAPLGVSVNQLHIAITQRFGGRNVPGPCPQLLDLPGRVRDRRGITFDAPFGHAGHRLHEWYFATRFWRSMVGDAGGTVGVDHSFAERIEIGFGAEIMGRGKFGAQTGPWTDVGTDDEWRGWWGPNPPFHTPVFVLTHHARPPIEMEGGTVFHFVDASPQEALDLAREAAGDLDVRIGGGPTVVRDFLAADLIDTLHVVQVPILLGRGARLWDGLEGVEERYNLEAVSSPSGVTHLTFTRR